MFTLNAMNNEKSTNQGTIYQRYSFPGKKPSEFYLKVWKCNNNAGKDTVHDYSYKLSNL